MTDPRDAHAIALAAGAVATFLGRLEKLIEENSEPHAFGDEVMEILLDRKQFDELKLSISEARKACRVMERLAHDPRTLRVVAS